GATVGLLESGKYFGPIRAPASGVLREVNADVLAKPRTLTDASYEGGWFARLQPTNFEEERRGLRSATDARLFLSKQIAALRVRCFAAFPDHEMFEHIVGRRAIEDAREHRVDAHRFAGAGRSGDEQMRHHIEIGHVRLAVDRFSQRQRQLRRRTAIDVRFE